MLALLFSPCRGATQTTERRRRPIQPDEPHGSQPAAQEHTADPSFVHKVERWQTLKNGNEGAVCEACFPLSVAARDLCMPECIFPVSDINEVQGGWVQGVARRGAASAGRSNKNPHFCEYMSSELAHSKGKDSKGKEKRPLCRMDGDHLRGRWMQTCDPRLIQRPDHFAYKRALPKAKGWCG